MNQPQNIVISSTCFLFCCTFTNTTKFNLITIRYREGGTTLDSDINIIGSDEQPPVIESYELSEYEVAAADTTEGVEITVNIRATDNCTEASRLLYCFALDKEKAPSKDEFTQNCSVSIHTNKNGMYALYVMDEAGNVAKETTELIVVDSKAPEITSISLEYPDMDYILLRNKWD